MAEETLFDQAAKPNEPAPATPTSEEAVQNFLEEYVGEGKKYKSVEELAKAKHHADKHIDELKTDLTSLKDFVAAQFEQMANKRNEEPKGPKEVDGERQPAPAAPPEADGEDLEARIAKILEERDETSRLQKNANLAQEVMIEHFGSQEEAVKAVRQKAEEMGVSPQFLADTAFRSPKALFNLMGINPDEKPRTPTTPASSSDVNPRMMDKTNPNPKQGTMAYYDQLRRSDPKKYWSVDVQSQLMKDALERGSDFFKR